MKWDLGNMRIGTRMAANVVVVLFFMGVALFQYHTVIGDVEEKYKGLLHVTGQIKEHAMLVTSLLQQAAIADKAFQIDHNPDTATRAGDLLKKAMDELGDMEAFERSIGDTAGMDETRKLKEQVIAVQKSFQIFRKSFETRGLTLDFGLTGQMRDAAHAMEERFLRIDNPMVQNHYLTMRRHEKDYFLWLDKKFHGKVRQSAEVLRIDLSDNRFSADEKSLLSGLLDAYLRTMDAVVGEDDALKSATQLLDTDFEKLAQNLLNKENSTTRMMDNTEQETLRQVHGDQKKAMMTGLIAVLMAISLATFLVYSIRKMLMGVASSLSASASQIAAAINEQDRISNLQASSVNETNTTMEELGSSSRQSAEQSESAASSAQKALEAAEHGMSRVEDMVQGMNVTKTKVDAIAQQILRLSEQTSQISTITGAVTDFANETKMLAMNAAVEAVRAGEHGKGFSVLAVEIRKLAEESKRSAERINALVAEIQKATNATVMATEEGGKTVDQGMMVAQNTAEAFAEVSEAVNNASQSSQQISLNVRQQAVAIKQVVEAMKSINTGAKETAAGISQVKTGTQVLNDAAQQLKSMI